MKTVTLQVIETGRSQEFRLDEAEPLLAHEQKLGVKNWTLPDTSDYILENGKLIERTGDQVDQKPGQSKGAKKGGE